MAITESKGERHLKRQVRKTIRRINRKVKDAAKEGYDGVWIRRENLTGRKSVLDAAFATLEDHGFTITRGGASNLVSWAETEDEE